MSEFPYEILKELYASKEWWKLVRENHAKFAPLLREYLATLPKEKVDELFFISTGGMSREDVIEIRDHIAKIQEQEIDDAIERILNEGEQL